MNNIEFNPFKDPTTGQHYLIVARTTLSNDQMAHAVKIYPHTSTFALDNGTVIRVIQIPVPKH